eukprot:TRINITY_DN26171_c0_g1_i1.p1 TRINITY_DN26171_c0_g1~~TRINITY_DN26171_c0_g1_i1.p1  ORF type:complete len:397 (+),score=28.74 TRINITY_DN26171_c0_g1_i1:239-1429(+)
MPSPVIPLRVTGPEREARHDTRGLIDETVGNVGKVQQYEGTNDHSNTKTWVFVLLAVMSIFLGFAWVTTGARDSHWAPQMTTVNATMQTDSRGTNWLESTASVNGITVFYYHTAPAGNPLPRLVYFHSGGMDGTECIRYLALLADEFQIFCPSARGHGKTSRVPPFSTEQFVKDAEGFLPLFFRESGDVSGDVSGESSTALDQQHTRSTNETADSSTEDTTLGASADYTAGTEERDSAVQAAFETVNEEEPASSVETSGGTVVEGKKLFLIGHSMGATIVPRVAKAHPEYVSAIVLEDPAWLRREGEDKSKDWPGSQPKGGDALSNESVDNVTVPALVLTSEFGDAVPEVLDAALATYKSVAKVYFPGCGHCIHCDDTKKYLETVRAFLLEHTGGL